MTLTEFRAALRTTLKDAATVWSDTELDRSMTHAIADLSRFMPRELTKEITLDFDEIDNESVTTESAHGTFKALANKPIKWDSETVTNTAGTTTYVRDTDYTIDYWNGEITTISTGSMSTTTEYHIDYIQDQTTVDISGLTDLIRVDRVEYPVGNVPHHKVNFDDFGGLLEITRFPMEPMDNKVQSNMSNKRHLRVFYHAQHTDPTASVAGSQPLFADEIVIKGAAGYSWLIEAAQHEHQAATDLTSARAALTSLAQLHTDAQVATDNVATEVALANGALDEIGVIGGTLHTAVSTAIAAARTSLAASTTALADLPDGSTPDYHALADAALDSASTQAAAGSTPISDVADASTPDYHALAGTALDAAAGELDTPSTASTGDFDLGEAAHTDVETYTTGGTEPSMKKYLETGDGTIPTVNVGDRVPEMYAQYARLSGDIANQFQKERDGYLQQASIRAALGSGYVQEATGRMLQVQRKLEEGEARFTQANVYVAEAGGRLQQVALKIQESNGRTSVGQGYLAEAETLLGQIQTKIREAEGYLGTGKGYAEQASFIIFEMDRYLEEARLNEQAASLDLELALKYRENGEILKFEFFTILSSRSQGGIGRTSTRAE